VLIKQITRCLSELRGTFCGALRIQCIWVPHNRSSETPQSGSSGLCPVSSGKYRIVLVGVPEQVRAVLLKMTSPHLDVAVESGL
jgi:hypothetical protein